jgi:hypothetical protein
MDIPYFCLDETPWDRVNRFHERLWRKKSNKADIKQREIALRDCVVWPKKESTEMILEALDDFAKVVVEGVLSQNPKRPVVVIIFANSEHVRTCFRNWN